MATLRGRLTHDELLILSDAMRGIDRGSDDERSTLRLRLASFTRWAARDGSVRITVVGRAPDAP